MWMYGRVYCGCVSIYVCLFFFFKQKTAYEMRISDWSSDVCSSDLAPATTRSATTWLMRNGSGSKTWLTTSTRSRLAGAVPPAVMLGSRVGIFGQRLAFHCAVNKRQLQQQRLHFFDVEAVRIV